VTAAPEPVERIAPTGDPVPRPTIGLPVVAPPGSLMPERVGLVNVANVLTVVRILMVPVFFLLLVPDRGSHSWWRAAATVVFVAASVTDRVDGELARRRGIVTDFGKIADPIADKALTGAAMIALSIIGDLPWWVTIVVMIREIGVTLLRFWVIRRGVLAASRGGKVKTVVQAFAIGFYLLPLTGFVASARAWLMVIAVGITLVTGADYVARAVRLRRATSGRALSSGAH
jgi:CDP-diacylglycerol--glycerol-3-phosphate 3-phosphatidyltransferase